MQFLTQEVIARYMKGGSHVFMCLYDLPVPSFVESAVHSGHKWKMLAIDKELVRRCHLQGKDGRGEVNSCGKGREAGISPDPLYTGTMIPHFNESGMPSRLMTAFRIPISHLIRVTPPSCRCSVTRFRA